MSLDQNPSDDIYWVRLTKQGARSAFSQLVVAYQRPIYNLCYRMLGDSMAAEDAAQEVFIRAYFKLDTYDEARKFSTWLYAIASHYCLDQVKRRRLTLISWEELAGWQQPYAQPGAQPERTLLAKETEQEVSRLIESLRPAYRMPVILKYWDGMSCEEIAQTLDTTVSAVKSKLFRARKMMARVAAQQEKRPEPALNFGVDRAIPMAAAV
jgi:RNA polymerase sigma-70 factor (ECF subfamily)